MCNSDSNKLLRYSDILSSSLAGKSRRLNRLFSPISGRTVIIPVDDSLIFGPSAGLEQVDSKLQKILTSRPEAVLGFPGLFRNNRGELLTISGVVNLTASTIRAQHTRKVQVGTIQQAVQLGADAVAVHVNIGSKYESEMLAILGSISQGAEGYGMPLLAIMYPRSEANGVDNNYEQLQRSNPRGYAELVAHAARVGVDLGADLIKTKYTGDPDTFRLVVEACRPIPVIVAGGPALPPLQMLQMAHEVILAGGGGVSFGRNVFSRPDPRPFVTALKAVVHQNATAIEALRTVNLEDFKE